MADRDVRGRRSPFELLIYASAVISATAFIAGAAPAPGSLAAIMPTWSLWAWYPQLLLGGLVGVVSAVWPRRHLVMALLLARAALVLLAGALTTYTAAAFLTNGLRAIGGGLLIGAWAAASAWRAWQVHRDLHTIHRILSDGELDLHKEPPP